MTRVRWNIELISSSVGTRLYSFCSATAIFAFNSRFFFSIVFITLLVSQKPSQKSSKRTHSGILGIAFSEALYYDVQTRTGRRCIMNEPEKPEVRKVQA